MTYLTSYLPFPSSSPLPPAGSHLIISDTLGAPGHFATYHLVSAALGKDKRRVVWVDFRGEGRASWEAVLKKIGTPLPQPTNQSFIHIAPSSLPASVSTPAPRVFDDAGSPSLRAVYDAIVPHVLEGSLVILDGLSELEWIGVPAVELGRFVRAMYAKSRRSRAILVSTLHADHLLEPSASRSNEQGELLERLLRIGSAGGVWWRVSHLPSGRSGDVMGEISSHPLSDPPTLAGYDGEPSTTSTSSVKDGRGQFTFVPRSSPLQYRLEASTVRVFPKGTGRGFL